MADKTPERLAGEATALAIVNSDAIGEKLVYLTGRWSDEKEYEDIKEYGAVLQALLPEGVKVEGMSKRPFGAYISIPGLQVQFLLFLNQRKGVITLKPRK